MRKIHEVLRLKCETGPSNRQIAANCALGRTTVADYLVRLEAAGELP